MIHISNLTKTYPDGTQALKGINLDLPTGMVGLLGPNGAGKSSLMRTIVGLQQADKGQIRLTLPGSNANAVIDVLKDPHAIRQTLGYLPQYFGVYPNMSCVALLKHMAVLKGLSKKQQAEQISKLLELTNLSAFANKSVNRFSGGMKQRFGIAQALLGDPKVVIMDEPTAGLDPEERERLHDMLISISKDKLILLSTHIVEDVENLCRYTALLFNGEIKAADSVANLVNTISGKIWTMPMSDIQTPTLVNQDDTEECQFKMYQLNKSFRFGEPVFRVFADSQPHKLAQPIQATLQDFYFYTRAQNEEQARKTQAELSKGTSVRMNGGALK